ncbi:Histone family protein nucleoid-structuring protein H-NS [Candidatus Glomeribacter gigasporarum BEG34]|uniref:Histone family protein nucleoid-structuring protein H-NS n=1 Tax=Candidatus Glomeribacter gigasporarum BEG34 TaxID=1070319 RepID=G2J980_9BURK|nr:H-NS histone family protein [Candidatus Glomeribacter gigasporarum]CCD29327.1 Histone family protein nucleoid-structuring protein H-NS [Candidatus Glomeribacter gigasporarum BEG34]
MSLYRELIVQREALDKQIESARAAEFDAVVSGIRQKMQTYGICLADLGLAPERGHPPRSSMRVAPKYVNPENPDQTWSGRGKAPKWMAGKDRADFLIQKARVRANGVLN